MAVINMLSWNVQVFGPNRYGVSPNNAQLVMLIGRVVADRNVNVFVLMELMNSVSYQICYSVCQAINIATGNPWRFQMLSAQPGGDREAYGIFWQTNAQFAVVLDNAGDENIALSPLQFPNNYSASYGRRAALATFRTTDTHQNFTVSVYHAPPNARAIQGLEALAKTPGLYAVNNAGAVQNVGARMLGGDYNLDVNIQPEYTWLTDPVPAVPPPAAAGQGAGTAPVTNADTHLIDMRAAVNRWGDIIANWSNTPADYRHLQLDNIFMAAPVGAGHVADIIADIMNPASGVRFIAQGFVLTNPATMLPAFPSAWSIPLPLNVNLSFAPCAWLLMRYGISDHLPVFATATI
jgi:hypothetical protein